MSEVQFLPITSEDRHNGVIGRTKNVEMIHRDRGGDMLLLTFNEMGMSADGKNFWCAAPAERLGCSVVGFVSMRANWFPHADMLALSHHLDAALAGRFLERVSIGLSQGGYAALKYSRLLRTTTNIAFSPQFSINADDIKDPRFNGFFETMLHVDMQIRDSDVTGRSVVIFDPYDKLDRKHSELIREAATCSLLPLAFAGHASIRAFTGAEVIGSVLRAARANDDLAIRQIYKMTKQKNVDRPYLAALALPERHPILSCRVFEKYRDLCPSREWINVCYRLSKAGLGARVVGWLASLAHSSQDDPGCWFVLSSVAHDIRDDLLARSAAKRALALKPEDPTYNWFLKHLDNQSSIVSR